MKNINTTPLPTANDTKAAPETKTSRMERSGFSLPPTNVRNIPGNGTGKSNFVAPTDSVLILPDHSGHFSFRYLLVWFMAVRHETIRLLTKINRMADDFKWAYYEWMDEFIEMEYDTETKRRKPPEGKTPGKRALINFFQDYREKLRRRIKDPFNQSTKIIAGVFEKKLIALNRFFTTNTDMQIPELEIVNREIFLVREAPVQSNVPALQTEPVQRPSTGVKRFSFAVASPTSSQPLPKPNRNFPDYLEMLLDTVKDRLTRSISAMVSFNHLKWISISVNAGRKEDFHSQAP